MGEGSISIILAFYVIDHLLNRSRFSAKYSFEKPNDRRALELMNAAGCEVLREIPDINFAYGISDEFRSAMLRRNV